MLSKDFQRNWGLKPASWMFNNVCIIHFLLISWHKGSSKLPGWTTPFILSHITGGSLHLHQKKTEYWQLKAQAFEFAWAPSLILIFTLTIIYHNHELSVRFMSHSGKLLNQTVVLETSAFETGVGSESVLMHCSLQLGRDPPPIFILSRHKASVF